MSTSHSHTEQIFASIKVLGTRAKRAHTATSRSRRRITGFIQHPKRGIPVTPPQAEISPYPHVSTALVGPSTAAVEKGVSFTLPRPSGVKVVPERRVSVEGDTLWNTQWNSRRCSDIVNNTTIEAVRGAKCQTAKVSFVEQPIVIPTMEIIESELEKPGLDPELELIRTSRLERIS